MKRQDSGGQTLRLRLAGLAASLRSETLYA